MLSRPSAQWRSTIATMRPSLRWLLLGSAVLAVVVPVGWWAVDRALQPAEVDRAPLVAAAAQFDVRIRRDEWGVPHILGKRNVDAAFGIAYAHAEDDYPTIQQVLLATRGKLAAEAGLDAAPTDYIANLLGVWQTIDQRYDRDLPPDLKAVLDAYAAGLNYYAATHENEVARGVLPFTGRDIAAGFVFKTPFFYGLDRELRRLNDLPPDPLPKGSNGVAVAPSRSTDGATRLLVNSHQPFTGPVAWYEAVVESGEGWHVAGGFFPGSPFLLHGHNAHLGWANTVNAPDLVDVYRLQLNPANLHEYRLDGRWVPFTRRDAKLRVRLWGPFRWTTSREVLWSVHGPVLQTRSGSYALRYAGMGEVRQALQYWRLNLARNVDEWRAAMDLLALPSINYVYADDKGNIGYVYNGQFPRRQAGVDWSGVLPGDRSDLVWQGYAPFSAVPQLWNPPSGLVFNANNTPFQATARGDGLDPAAFPGTWGIQRNMTNRAWRLLETYGADTQISPEEFRAYKFDAAYSPRSEVARVAKELAVPSPQDGAALAAARQVLASWNLQTDRANRGAALGVLATTAVLGPEGDGNQGVGPQVALEQAAASLQQHFGRLDPAWGEVNRLRRGAADLPLDGAPDILRAVYGKPAADGRLGAVAGDTYIMFVSWDKAGRLHSESVHQFGSATERPASPHYVDQAPWFASQRTKPVRFTQAQLAGHVVEDYRPGEARRSPREAGP